MSAGLPAPHRMLALLVIAVVAVASVGYLATAAEPEPSYGPLPTHRQATPHGLVWDVEDTDHPEQMPIYRLEPAGRSGGEAAGIAEELGMEPHAVTYDVSRGAYQVEDPARGASLTVSADGSRIVYDARSARSSLTDPPVLPSDDRARQRATEILQGAGLMPSDVDVDDRPRVTVDETVARCQAATEDADGTCRQVNLTKSVQFDQELDGHPLIGASSLDVELGHQGQLVGLVVRSAQVQPAGSRSLVPVDRALDVAQRGDGTLLETRPEACGSRVIDEVHVSYFVPRWEALGEPWGADGPWVFPVYSFQASCEDRAEEASGNWSVRIHVPAVR